MQKILYSLLFLVFNLFQPALAEDKLPANVQTITPQELSSHIENSSKPFVLLIYTSWCPYCKKQIMELSAALSQTPPLALPPILAVSIDADPVAYSQFIRQHVALPWPNKLYMGHSSIEQLLAQYGSSFNGPIPYLAVFQNREIVKEFNGLTAPQNLLP